MNKKRINLTTKVNAQQIRHEVRNGREHWVVPSYTLPANVVMNGGLYPAAEIDASYSQLEGTLAPLGHPTINGEFASAFTPEAINSNHIGAFNRNAKKVGNRIYVEKWIDIEFAKNTERGPELLERLEALERGDDVPPIHTSVALFVEELEPNKEQKSAGANWVAKIHSIDHDAILLDEVGAATPEQGVGMMVNADAAVPLKPNAGVLEGESYRERERRLDRAATKQFATEPESWVWVGDFTDTQVVIVRNGGDARVYNYKIEGGVVTFEGDGTEVLRNESWVAVAANNFKRIFNRQAKPVNQPKEGEMPLTAEEQAALTKDISAAVTANMNETLKPIIDKVDSLAANQKVLSDALTANQLAAEADKRKVVAEKLGEVVANALSGEALEEAFQKVGSAAPLSGAPAVNSDTDNSVPDPAKHFASLNS